MALEHPLIFFTSDLYKTPLTRVRMNFSTNKNLHGSRTDPSFSLHGTRRTVQVFEQQTVPYAVKEFAQLPSKICPGPCKGL